LRGHPSEASELFLLLAARDWDPSIRTAAVSSLGWWEPCHPREVRCCLKEARRESNLEVRQAARAALARLGECQALQWFRQALVADDNHRIHDAVQAVASEGITLLWPDLDRLADADDPDISLHARDALERLREDLRFPCS
jgi:HEAT repeat protein